MKAFVITIDGHAKSEWSAERCIKSAKKHGLEVKKFNAFTPAHNPERFAEKMGIPTDRFKEKYSRYENCLAAFISHHSIWELAVHYKEDVVVFEHDAVIKDEIPEEQNFKGVLSYGAPSYGRFVTPMLGVHKLTSKQYLPGAHAYRVKPSAAKVLIDNARTLAAPTDLYLCNQNFPFIEEMYPWPVVADDSFTTIQNEVGCQAKHNFNQDYQVI